MSTSDIETSTAERFTGRVKWFNNKSGYGFITASSGDIKGTDIFVHHSSIVVADSQYKYLVQGEYVEFVLTKLNSGGHEYQASDISGIDRGQLMCETRREIRSLRPKVRGPGPRDGENADAKSSPVNEEEAIQEEEDAIQEEDEA